ncbi:MAG: hypothetical protein OSA97_04905 [Nevskia sp.]|nr:hypothetical protein [Nevskia sp.]
MLMVDLAGATPESRVVNSAWVAAPLDELPEDELEPLLEELLLDELEPLLLDELLEELLLDEEPAAGV